MGKAETQWASEILHTMLEAIDYASKLARGTRRNLVVSMSPETFSLLEETIFEYTQPFPTTLEPRLYGVPIEIDKCVTDGCVYLTEKLVRAVYEPSVDALVAADIEEGKLYDLLRQRSNNTDKE